jgi:hypothetical protein
MKLRTLVPLAILLGTQIAPAQQSRTVQVRTSKGVVEGAVSADNIRAFKGIPIFVPR